ncbi:hypothetical protein HN789_00060 [archaeon]|jgi:dTDP-4-dehydrorhamnose 3,5-epimerase-like enzyme|nr:hypothetical protein [archaeon]MBT4022242.1 hypothetical protein [archaeon]MBT4460649.1 hypothetical protein [archaeon]MBT5424529.1 hypothetical protein [archaeon]MBT7439613.1 hypothetical protein [archaeon]
MPNENVKKIDVAYEDARGKISNIVDADIKHIAIITSKKGSIRANHYHPKQIQYIYLISGQFESFSKDLTKENTEIEKIIIDENSFVTTPPMIAHAMKFTEDSVMLNITTGARESENFEEHTVKYDLIQNE